MNKRGIQLNLCARAACVLPKVSIVMRWAVRAALVLTLATTAEAFFWDHLHDHLHEGFVSGVVGPLTESLFGGGTKIVYNALTYNFLGIQPVLKRVWSTVLIEGGSWIVSGVIEVVWFIIQGIATIIYRIVEEIIERLLDLKRDIIYYGFRLITSLLASGTPLNSLALRNSLIIAKSQDPSVNDLAKTMDEGPPVKVLRGGRSVDHKYHHLKDEFLSATRHDPMQCLPLVFCAIHADPDDLLSTLEAAFRKAFRPYFAEQPVPDWAEQYVQAADTGTTAKSSESCREAYPSCEYSARHLRHLIAQAIDAEDTNLLLPQQ